MGFDVGSLKYAFRAKYHSLLSSNMLPTKHCELTKGFTLPRMYASVRLSNCSLYVFICTFCLFSV